MLHPYYRIEIGDLKIEHKTCDLSSLTIDLSLDIPSHLSECQFRIGGDASKISNGDPVTVSLGYDEDDLTTVFKGFVDTIETRSSLLIVQALTSMLKLCKLRIDKFYEHQNAGFIVKDLANIVNISTDVIEDGIDLPYYTVDNNSNAYEHIRYLGLCSDVEIYSTNLDMIVFRKDDTEVKHFLRFGKDIIKVERIEYTTVLKSVRIIGESPSSFRGAATSHWLTKQVIEGRAEDSSQMTSGGTSSSGSSGYDISLSNKIVRNTKSASNVATAYLNRLRSRISLMIEVIGNPKIMLGQTISIRGFPEEIVKGNFKVSDLQHNLSKTKGFTTIVKCRGV
jgi:phage protein D